MKFCVGTSMTDALAISQRKYLLKVNIRLSGLFVLLLSCERNCIHRTEE